MLGFLVRSGYKYSRASGLYAEVIAAAKAIVCISGILKKESVRCS